METIFYTYIYLDPTKPGRFTYGNFVTFFFEPYYVGKGKGDRFLAHVKESKLSDEYACNLRKIRKLRKIKNKGYEIKDYIMFLRTSMPEFMALNCSECFWIYTIGRKDLGTGPLVNLTTGGDGAIPGPETRDKLRTKKIGKTYEEIMGDDEAAKNRKEQISKRMRGNGNHFFGKTHNKETKQRISKNRIGKSSGTSHWIVKNGGHSAQSKQKMSESHKQMTGERATKALRYKVISPDGKIYIFASNFYSFCSLFQIKSPQFLRETKDGKRESYKGWVLYHITKEEYDEYKKKYANSIITPGGEFKGNLIIIEGRNLA